MICEFDRPTPDRDVPQFDLICYYPSPIPGVASSIVYPNVPPKIFIRSEALSPVCRLSVAAALHRAMFEKVGTGMLYDALLGAIEEVSTNIKKHAANVVCHKGLFVSHVDVEPASAMLSAAPVKSAPSSTKKPSAGLSASSLASLRARLSSMSERYILSLPFHSR